jgi:glyoxylase-like metal-dependent hydrolase (beta-lactamase superfamily II)
MKIIDGVYRLETARFSHIYYIPQEEILIDTGMPFHADKIMQEIQSLGHSVKSILLTHHDIDHTGNVRYIQQATNASVWIGSEDEPFLMGKQHRPGKKHIFETILRVKPPFSCTIFPKTAQCTVENITLFFTPGHTPGHHIFCYKNILFSGDLFWVKKVKSSKFEEMAQAMNWDTQQAKQSIKLLKNIDFDLACPSHGEPVKKDRQLLQFIEGIQIV